MATDGDSAGRAVVAGEAREKVSANSTVLDFARIATGFGMLLLCAGPGLARADVLRFIASDDGTGTINYSWFSPNNWYTNDSVTQALYHVGRLPVPGDTAVIDGSVNAAGNNISLIGLTLSAGATVNGGVFSVATVSMTDAGGGGLTSFHGSSVSVLSAMQVLGGGCSFDLGTLTIEAGAICQLGVGGLGELGCTGSSVYNRGEIILFGNGSQLMVASNLVNQAGGMISAGTNSFLGQPELTQATFDNNGVVQATGGTFHIGAFTTWLSSGGLGQYKTTSTNAVLQFTGGMTVPANATNIFAGPGVIQLQNGGTAQGVMQVGVFDTASQTWEAGTLQFQGILDGSGKVRVTGVSNYPSTLSTYGTANVAPVISVVEVDIDAFCQLQLNDGPIFDGCTVNNSGTTTWGPGQELTFSSAAVFNNLAGGLFDIQVDGVISGGPNGGTLNNFGIFRRSGGTQATIFVAISAPPGPNFNNAGLLDVRSGIMKLSGGTNTGTFSMAPGTEIWIAGGTNAQGAGASITGTNFFRVTGSSVLMVNRDLELPTLGVQDSAVVDGPANLTISNVFNWTGGTLQGSGALNIPAGALFIINSPFGSMLNRNVNNAGTTGLYSPNGMGAGNGAVFNNLAGALFDLGNGGVGYDATGAMAVFNNYGVFQQATNKNQLSMWMNFINFSTVQIQTGTTYYYNFQQNAGSTTVASNATLRVNSALGVALKGGTLGGSGTISGTITNYSGTVMPGSNGALTVAGAYVQTGAGMLAVVVSGRTSGTQYSQIYENGANGLVDGALDVSFVNGFMPSLGDSFVILTSPYNISGTFSSLNGLRPGNGLVLVPVYNPYNITLVAATDPTPSSPGLGTSKHFFFSFPSTSTLTNVVEYADSLNPPNWLPLATIVGDGTLKSVMDTDALSAHRFYRVRFQ